MLKTKKKLAELIKHLSDEGSKLKILLVGIAETSAELTAGHQSVSRCLKEVKLENMKISELKEIILKGAAALKLRFESRVVNKIVNLSSGYPHFTHLLALKAAEEAIVEERKEVTYDDLVVALGKSIDDAEGTLRATYNLAIRSASEEYKKILLALSICPDEEIRARDIRNKYQELFKTEISQGTLNNYFQRLVSDDDSAILRRLAQGIYRFNDPRMPSFIKIVQSYLD